MAACWRVLLAAAAAGPASLSGAASASACLPGDSTCLAAAVEVGEEAALLQVHGGVATGGWRRKKKSLLVIDMQNDFMDDFPNATLKVTGASEIIGDVNKLVNSAGWEQVFFTTDFHPANHISFASNQQGNMQPFTAIDVQYDSNFRICGDANTRDDWRESSTVCAENDVQVAFEQELWPPHCIQGTDGQHIDSRVDVPLSGVIVRKGINTVIDSYGAFVNNVGSRTNDTQDLQELTENSLNLMLKEQCVHEVFLVGLAFDYCVYNTAIQAAERGYDTYIIKDVTRSVDPSTDASHIAELQKHGVKMITLQQYWKGKY